MGRKSIAEKLLAELPKQDSYDRTLLVLYDFTKTRAPVDFYNNLSRITELVEEGSSLVQYSAYRTASLKAAIAAARLASRYKADVAIYTVNETSLEALTRMLQAAQE